MIRYLLSSAFYLSEKKTLFRSIPFYSFSSASHLCTLVCSRIFFIFYIFSTPSFIFSRFFLFRSRLLMYPIYQSLTCRHRACFCPASLRIFLGGKWFSVTVTVFYLFLTNLWVNPCFFSRWYSISLFYSRSDLPGRTHEQTNVSVCPTRLSMLICSNLTFHVASWRLLVQPDLQPFLVKA